MQDSNEIIYQFSKDSRINSWRIVDDVVMGGKSNGNFKLNKEGKGNFFGEISLKNNGGFSSLRYRFKEKDISKYSKVKLKVKGDGKKYQFRIKRNLSDYHSYISEFKTNGEWQTITISITDMYPAFRGRKLNMNNLSSTSIEEVAFLIGNKKEESFQLLIDKIFLE